MRVQIQLGQEELTLLDQAAAASGASRSELVRRAVRRTFGTGATEDRLAALRAAAGTWRDRPFDGAAFVDATRGDLNERLRRLDRS
jgi:Arc/MetJ-type ribon-helix-helix transcriptional regulator